MVPESQLPMGWWHHKHQFIRLQNKGWNLVDQHVKLFWQISKAPKQGLVLGADQRVRGLDRGCGCTHQQVIVSFKSADTSHQQDIFDDFGHLASLSVILAYFESTQLRLPSSNLLSSSSSSRSWPVVSTVGVESPGHKNIVRLSSDTLSSQVPQPTGSWGTWLHPTLYPCHPCLQSSNLCLALLRRLFWSNLIIAL